MDIDTKTLLTDDQLAQFIARGYLVLENDLPASFHELLLNKIKTVFAEEGNPGNNILPRIPEIDKCFNTPTVRGALTSILGEDYYMHPHRHCHHNQPGKPTPQAWHKDGYWSAFRSHRPWWAMIFYYTQDVTEEMGPTGIMPGSQFYEQFPGNESVVRMPSGKAGTMVMVHFDLWHRASHNISGLDRYMMKFQFVRLQAPRYPTWNHKNPEFSLPEGASLTHPHKVIWQDIWNWMLGNGGSGPRTFQAMDASSADQAVSFICQLETGDPAAKILAADELGLMGRDAVMAVNALKKTIADSSEQAALNAAYALGKIGPEGVSALLDVLMCGNEESTYRAAYGLSAAGEPAVAGLVQALQCEDAFREGCAAYALGMIGYAAGTAVPALIQLLDHPSPWVKRNAVEALGMIRQPARDLVPALIRVLEQEESAANEEQGQYIANQGYIKHKITYTAALSLLRLGQVQEAKEAVKALRTALEDDDRYVRAYAGEALTHIRSDEAVQVMIEYFRRSRWCPSTSKKSTF